MLQLDERKVKLNNLRPGLDELDRALGLETVIREVKMPESESAFDGSRDSLEKAQKVQQWVKQLRDKIEGQQKRKTQWDDLMTLCELGNGAEDETPVSEVEEGFVELEAEIEEAKLSTLLTSEYDGSNAILTFHAGADGTEAQNRAQMFFHMYTRWTERHGYVCKTLDYLDGDEAGLKSAITSTEGESAYGHFKSEHGVHRLVRVSPSDTNARRQTSFAALEVMPEIPGDVEVDIRLEDVEMQVFRPFDAGSQRINKTSSVVRLIHKPTGIVASCRTERSQFQNRDTCVWMLRSELAELQMQAHAEKISDIKGIQLKIEWGSQIRSYVFISYQLVKDNRIGYEISNINAAMDGGLDGFINTYLEAEAIGNWVKE